jgi:serine/threonine-protein kinase RsbW
MNFKVTFKMESDTKYLSALRDWVRASADEVGASRFPDEAVMKVTLALVEAVDNAIFHAHRRKKDMPIDIALEVGDGGVILDVADMGRGITDLNTPEPDFMSDHGRGLFIIRSVMSKVESHMRDGRHHLRMVYSI